MEEFEKLEKVVKYYRGLLERDECGEAYALMQIRREADRLSDIAFDKEREKEKKGGE